MTGADFTQLPLTQDDAPGEARSTPVTCLGLTFADDTERRAHYRERLAEKLRDPSAELRTGPAFRAIEGFPIAEDEAILALSDPPYYTACPNPFLPEIMAAWQAQRRAIRERLGLPDDAAPDNGGNGYHCEPFAADVSEGKGDPIYNAHSYHTKVPHKAIMRYILHYTAPGDIVLDGFCGTGMTGVAAQLCGDRRAVADLGYRVDADGVIYEGTKPISRLGIRKTALVDLSPAATFIAYNYNAPADTATFEQAATRVLAELDSELGWMYETWHPHCEDPRRVRARINYTVWSEVFACPACSEEIVYYDVAADTTGDEFTVKQSFNCPRCQVSLEKKTLDRLWSTDYDLALKRTHALVRYRPVLINYQVGSHRLEKQPDAEDIRLLQTIDSTPVSDGFPVQEMPTGERKEKDGYSLKGITYLHHFYYRRSLLAYARLWQKVSPLRTRERAGMLQFFVQGSCLGFTKLNRYSANHFSQVNRYFSGTLFVASMISEASPAYSMTHKLGRLSRLQLPGRTGQTAITCQSTTDMRQMPDGSVDYVFVDPPFGNNLHYSELNFFWEAWLEVLTRREPEAVMDKGRNRTLADYQGLMVAAFAEIYRVLKPGRWMTVEFHNSQNRVWNAIQEAMLRVGFVVADVRTLDKQQETYKQSIQKLVKQDLVISAYKPTTAFEQRFLSHAGTEEAAWDFVRQHLAHVPAVVWGKNDRLETVAERQNYLLFDRMVAYHIQRGVAVPLGAAAFYAGLHDRFAERDGMYFLPEQTAEYDRARLRAAGMAQLAMFVSDEKSAVAWLRAQFLDQPATFQEIQPRFLQELHQARHEALPDLRVLLEENFLQDEAGRWYVPDPNKAEDLEKLRLRGLLREFQGYMEGRGRLRQFRTEAVRAGFAQAWRARDYATIVKVAERLPEDVLQEDPDLLMYTDNASLRVN